MMRLAPVVLVLALAGCGGTTTDGTGGAGRSEAISKATFSGTWPFTVAHGTVGCDQGAITFTAPDGTAYGINGSALDAGYPDATPIWSKDPSGFAPNVSVGDVSDEGRSLC